MLHLRQVIRKNIEDMLQSVYTSLPAVVIDYDADIQTATVQPLINWTDDDGVVNKDAPIATVPVIMPSAGGGIISFPVKKGDTVLLHFSMRSIDSWMEGDGSQSTPPEDRLHDVNDAFAIPGLYPKQNSLQTNADDVEIKFKGNRVTLKANGDIEIEGGRIDLGEGATEAIVLGSAFKDLFNNHTHPDPSSGSTGVPSTQMGSTHLSSKVYSK